MLATVSVNSQPSQKLRQENLDPEIQEIAAKAWHRPHTRYSWLLSKGKSPQQTVTAVGREMLGLIDTDRNVSQTKLTEKEGRKSVRTSTPHRTACPYTQKDLHESVVAYKTGQNVRASECQ